MKGRRILAFFALLLVRLLRVTWRVRVVGAQRADGLYAFWHGDQIGLCAFDFEPVPAVLVSRSRDGELASRVANALITFGATTPSPMRLRLLTSTRNCIEPEQLLISAPSWPACPRTAS